VSLSGGVATFSNSNAATGKTVSSGTLGNWSLTGADAGNYTLTSVANTTADITKRNLTVTATASNKTYDRTTTASVTLTNDLLPLDDGLVTVNYTGANFADANAGTGKTVDVTGLSLSGLSAGNYQLPSTTVSTTANIDKAALTLSFTVASAKTYDGTKTAAVTGSSLFGIQGDDTVTVSGLTAEYADKNVGTSKAVTLTNYTLEGAQGGNYTVTTVTPRTANITAKDITATFTAADKTYDGTTAATIAGSSFVGTVSGDAVSLTGTATFGDKNVGTGKTVTLSSPALTGADAANYNLTGSVPSTTANITVRTVTPVFTADNKLYDGTTEATLTFVSDDRASGDAGTSKLDYTYTANFASAEIGTWTVNVTGITLTGSEASNYVLDSTTRSYTADIQPIPNNPPDVVTTSGNTSYNRGQPGVIVDSGVTVTDSDSSDFDTGFLEVTITNRTTGDVLGISSQGTGAGQISVTGTSVFYEGVQIGTITLDGTGSNDLRVTLTSAANAVNVQALARRVTFANTETVPDTTTRTIQFAVNDGDGGTSSGATKDVNVLLGNTPVVTTTSGTTSYTESTTTVPTAAVTIDSGITVTDSDTTVFNGGYLRVSYAANGTADDRLSIRTVNTAGNINVLGTAVRYVLASGATVTFGTISSTENGVGTTPLKVDFNANATPEYVQLLARAIQFQNVNVYNPSTLDRSVSFKVSDGDAGESAAGLKTVSVIGTNDRPTLSGIPTTASYSQGSTSSPNQLRAASAGVPTDPDGDGYSSATPFAFYNASLRVRVGTGGNAGDRLSISNPTGVPSDLVVTRTGTTSGNMLVGGVQIGTYTLSSGATATLTVTFLNDGSATQARIQALLRSVGFSTTRSAPSGTVQLNFSIGEGVPPTYSGVTVAISLAP
jgi:hypothetical protein